MESVDPSSDSSCALSLTLPAQKPLSNPFAAASFRGRVRLVRAPQHQIKASLNPSKKAVPATLPLGESTNASTGCISLLQRWASDSLRSSIHDGLSGSETGSMDARTTGRSGTQAARSNTSTSASSPLASAIPLSPCSRSASPASRRWRLTSSDPRTT